MRKVIAFSLLFLFLVSLKIPASDFARDRIIRHVERHSCAIGVYYHMDEQEYLRRMAIFSKHSTPYKVEPIGEGKEGEYIIAYVGSGGVIPGNGVLTASHLFDHSYNTYKMEIWVYLRTDKKKIVRYSAEIVCKTNLDHNPWRDYAVLYVQEDLKLPGLKLAKKEPRWGDRVIWSGSMSGFMYVMRGDHLGFMKDFFLRNETGYLSIRCWVDHPLYRISPGAPGDSGSMLLNKKGEILSVICWGINLSDQHCYLLANPLSMLRGYLAEEDFLRLWE